MSTSHQVSILLSLLLTPVEIGPYIYIYIPIYIYSLKWKHHTRQIGPFIYKYIKIRMLFVRPTMLPNNNNNVGKHWSFYTKVTNIEDICHFFSNYSLTIVRKSVELSDLERK